MRLSSNVENAYLQLNWDDPLTGEPFDQIISSPAILGRDADCAITLNSGAVSRHHAKLEVLSGDEVQVTDVNSTNGTLVNGKKITKSVLTEADSLQIGPFTFSVSLTNQISSKPPLQPPTKDDFTEKATLAMEHFSAETLAMTPEQLLAFAEAQVILDTTKSSAQKLSFPPPIFDQTLVPIKELSTYNLEPEETTYLTVGGGLGSFVWVDHLLIHGADLKQVTAIGVESKPYSKFSRFAQNSQIPEYERLRSDSGATPDNIWGFPGYAIREIWRNFRQGNIKQALSVGWQIFAEPTFAETYTPIAGNMFASVDREAKRIGWENIWRFGRVRSIRKTDDGRYIVAYSQSTDEGRVHRVMIAQYLHLAVGYPGIRFLPDLQAYREQSRDFKSVVNAYENHNHVYDNLIENGGTVLIRGRGIVASRVLQRIDDARQQNPQIKVIHLMRSPNPEGNRYGHAKRLAEYHFEFQPFNWPKAAFGGDLRFLLEAADSSLRQQLLNDWGGTTTANRSDWREILQRGETEGWYQIRFGHVDHVERNDERIITLIRGLDSRGEQTSLIADFIIDATGLNASVNSNPLLRDLIEHYELELNQKGGFLVSPNFEIKKMQNDNAHLFAVGVSTLGGAYAPVDSFVGLQYAAQRSMSILVEGDGSGLKPLSPIRSMNQWWRWARGVRP